MIDIVFQGIMVPFIGTALGASCVFFMKKAMNSAVQSALTGFAAGVMIAASVWSLLFPAMEQAGDLGRWSFLPAVIGFWAGISCLLLLNQLILRLHLHINGGEVRGIKSGMQKTTMLAFAVALHNIPDGMAVGVVYAGWLTGNAQITMMEAFVLSIGIAAGNLPEGAIVSMPLCAAGIKKPKAFFYGVLSGIVEPIAAVLTILAAEAVVPILPYLLGFAAGGMLYVTAGELIPEMSEGDGPSLGTVMFAAGFSMMMVLDAALG